MTNESFHFISIHATPATPSPFLGIVYALLEELEVCRFTRKIQFNILVALHEWIRQQNVSAHISGVLEELNRLAQTRLCAEGVEV